MIKLIRRGSPRIIEYTCKHCGSLFSFEEEDLNEEINKEIAEWAQEDPCNNLFT